MEYTPTSKGSKISADYVKPLPEGTLAKDEIQSDVMSGVVVRPIRCTNPDQDAYPGLIRVNTVPVGDAKGSQDTVTFEFSMTSLSDIFEFVQKGDEVTFQVGLSRGRSRAVSVKPIRSKHKVSLGIMFWHHI